MEKFCDVKKTAVRDLICCFTSVEERYNPLLKKSKVFRPSLVLRVQDEKTVEVGTHQEFPLNLSGVCIFHPFKVRDYQRLVRKEIRIISLHSRPYNTPNFCTKFPLCFVSMTNLEKCHISKTSSFLCRFHISTFPDKMF